MNEGKVFSFGQLPESAKVLGPSRRSGRLLKNALSHGWAAKGNMWEIDEMTFNLIF